MKLRVQWDKLEQTFPNRNDTAYKETYKNILQSCQNLININTIQTLFSSSFRSNVSRYILFPHSKPLPQLITDFYRSEVNAQLTPR